MLSEKSFDISINPSKIFMSDNPIKSKSYCRVFIDSLGEGSWSIVNDNLYDIINDSVVFIDMPIGKYIALQIATTPTEFTQSPTENTMVLSIKNEIKVVSDNIQAIIDSADINSELLIVSNAVDSITSVADNITNVNNVGTNITNVNNVGNNIDNVNAVSGSITNVNNVGNSITNVNNVGNSITNVNNVGNNIDNVNNVGNNISDVSIVSTNVLKVNTVSSNISKVITVSDSVDNVDTVGTNIANVNIVATNIIDVQNAEENATLAVNSKNLAEKWASEDRGVVVEAGKYSAKHWAEVAEETVTIGIIDDVVPSNTKTYSSNKIDSLDSTINTKISTHTPLSGVTPYNLLSGNLSISNEVITNGFGLYTYTGNTTVLPTIPLAMDIESQWGNDTTEKYGYLIIIKSRSASGVWSYVNSIRGRTKYTDSSTTGVEGTDANMFTLSTVGGNTTINIGTSTRTNVNGVTYYIEVYQTTHIKTHTTNHNKTAIEHYNMFTGFTIENYEGSGLAGHTLLHSLSRKLSAVTIKNLTTASTNWIWFDEFTPTGYCKNLNGTIGNSNTGYDYVRSIEGNSSIVLGTDNGSFSNASTNQYIMYGWTNSYFDESNKLIGNYEIGTYQGTATAGNKITTRGKPAWVMIKNVTAIANWVLLDNIRGNGNNVLYPNLSNQEGITAGYGIDILSEGFMIDSGAGVADVTWNALGNQYQYMVCYDNDSGSGKSKYPRATDTSNVQINNAIIPFANGVDAGGTKISTTSKNETITGLTYTAGKNYLYALENGTYGVKPYRPRYLRSDLIAEKAGDNPDYFDVFSNTWYSTNVATSIGNVITLNSPLSSRNYLNHIVYADANGQLTYEEELPKVEYKDIIKANEYQGKNACTAWVNFDGTTTPPTIRDSYNVSSVIRTATGTYCVYFEEHMDTNNYSISITSNEIENLLNEYNTSYVKIVTRNNTSTYINALFINISFFGGKN